MSIELTFILYGIFAYTLGLLIGFSIGRDHERYKYKKDIWDQDAH